MNLVDHIKEHVALGLDFRIPAEGSTYIKFTATTIEFYVEGVQAGIWTKPV